MSNQIIGAEQTVVKQGIISFADLPPNKAKFALTPLSHNSFTNLRCVVLLVQTADSRREKAGQCFCCLPGE